MVVTVQTSIAQMALTAQVAFIAQMALIAHVALIAQVVVIAEMDGVDSHAEEEEVVRVERGAARIENRKVQ